MDEEQKRAAEEAKKREDETREAAQKQAREEEQARSAEITETCARHGLAQLAGELIRSGATVADANKKVLDELSKRDAARGGQVAATRIENGSQDEHSARVRGIEEAITVRMSGDASKLTDLGRQFTGMSLLEMGREMLEGQSISTRGMSKMELAGAMLKVRSNAFQGTGDFPSLMSNVANKRLRQAYEENPGTFRRWARRAPNLPDFKAVQVTQFSAMPDLLQTNEHGEFKYGAVSDGAVNYNLLTYGRILPFTRQAMINDDLRAFDRILSGFGASAARLENRTVYAQITSNPTMVDGVALFHASHGNLAGAGAIDVTTLSAGRKAMRKQKGLQNEELNLAPSYLLGPSDLEQVMYQYTSANYVPATSATINEFRSGGRTALEPIVEPILDAASASQWYLAANSSQVDTVEYAYLDGAEGVQTDMEVGFEVDGVSIKARLDFVAKVIDYRGLFRNG